MKSKAGDFFHFDRADFDSFQSFFEHFHPTPPPHSNPQPSGVQFRSVDGSGNNLTHTDFNQAGSDFVRAGPANFADGVDAMVAAPNARMISNVVVAGNGDLANAEGLSGMMYAWGQFIDHDLNLADEAGTTNIDIAVPAGDPNLAPGSVIPVTRVNIDPATGHDGIPAAAVNSVTGWLDASMIYGSDPMTASSLRMADGHMKTSAGGNLPVDPQTGLFLAGDIRAQENPDLTALQTLFVREHNYQVDLLHEEHPKWTGDQLYQQAKAIVTAEIAHITYSEFLPHLLGPDTLTAYQGYDPNVDPRIMEEFAGAAYRFGHSLVSAELTKFDEQGQTLADEDLKDAFFESPAIFEANGGADALLRHLGADESNALDVHIVDDLRNFLFDPPHVLDLAAINIQRGHDLGLGSLNQTREAFGLTAYTSFDQISSDPTTVAALEQAYNNDINSVDLWTGGLAEDHAAGAMIGETFGTIIAQQFENLRDGDRYWYENQGFDAKTLNQIENTTLSDIIARDTDTNFIQPDVFVFYDRHSGTAGGIASEEPTAPQLVIGSDGVDTLVGGPQADILVAGAGKQTMTGMAGADTFVFGRGTTYATITDFTPGVDKLQFDNVCRLDHRGVQIRQEHGNTIVTVGDDHIVLVGVNPHQISPHHDLGYLV
jgi:Animal haem peroxidase/RTX calcium-binding nonapeptide repeat (4 copies)